MDDYRNYGRPTLWDKIRPLVAFVLIVAAFGFAGSIEFDSLQATSQAEKSERRVIAADPILFASEVSR